MQTPVFRILNVPAITHFVGTNPARIYPFGEAPQHTAKPYIVHQMIAVTPYDRMAGTPQTDRHRVQIDVYAATQPEASALALAVRDALDCAKVGYTLALQLREPGTGLYRYGFDADWILDR